jgi:hypothetical protein
MNENATYRSARPVSAANKRPDFLKFSSKGRFDKK